MTEAFLRGRLTKAQKAYSWQINDVIMQVASLPQVVWLMDHAMIQTERLQFLKGNFIIGVSQGR